MKTQIIQLDEFDDIISARDRVGWSKSPRILIVFPKKKILRFSLTELVLLYRQANRQGAVAAIVLKNPEIRVRLEQAGLTCFGTLAEANQSRWRVGKRMKILERDLLGNRQTEDRKSLKPQSMKADMVHAAGWRIPVFVLAWCAFLAVLALFLPKAHIVIDAGQKEQQYSIDLQGSSNRETAPFNSLIKLHPFSITVEGNVQVDATGSMPVDNKKAHGFVIITNLSGVELAIPTGLVVLTVSSSPVRFMTTQPATLSAGAGEAVSVPVQSLMPGETGNVPAGAIAVVEGDIGLSIRVNNSDPLLGGTTTSVTAPTHSDYTKARTDLLQKLDAAALEKSANILETGQIMVQDSLKLQENIQEKLDPQIGMPGEQLNLWMQAEYSGWYILESDAQRISIVLLDAVLPAGYLPLSDPIEMDFAEPAFGQMENLVWPVTLSRSIEKDIPPGKLIALIKGQSPQLAAGMLAEELQLGAAPQVRLVPGWWPVMPFFSFQYEIVKE